MNWRWIGLLAALVSCQLSVVSCSRQGGAAIDKPSASSPRIFSVKGIVKELNLPEKQVRIEHEKIPDYMDAMTMSFDVKNTNELTGLQPGDYVSFRMTVTTNDGWIDQITRLGTTKKAANAPDTFRRVREVEPLKVGDVMPEYHFTNEVGQPVNLSDFKGQAVAITFLFTRCPYPTFCPRMASNFNEVYKKLKANPNAPTNWHLLAITFDPDFDTPEVLKSYAKRYTYDPAKWNYLTGELIDITAITEQFGLMFWRPDPTQVTGISHNLRTVVIDAQGKVQKVFTENNWKVDDLVEEMIKAAGGKT